MTLKDYEQMERIIERLLSQANRFKNAAVIDAHQKGGLVGYLRSEAALLEGVLNRQEKEFT